MLGPHSLSDVDLLAVLLGTGTEGESAVKLAVTVLDGAGGLTGLKRLGPHALSARRGIGPAKAARIAAGLELGERVLRGSLSERPPVVGSFDAVVEWGTPRLGPLAHEEVWLLALDGRNGLRTAQRIAQGGLHGCALTPRDVLWPALRDAAAAIVLLHNHPSGDPTPSNEDVVMTRSLSRACEIVGIELLDHVVIARGGASSLRELGAL